MSDASNEGTSNVFIPKLDIYYSDSKIAIFTTIVVNIIVPFAVIQS
jgi:hypothetical protein